MLAAPVAALLCASLLTPGWASGGHLRATQTLTTHAEWSGSWTLVSVSECGAQPSPESSFFCLRHMATATLPGLGSVLLAFTSVQDTRGGCVYLLVTGGSLATHSQGTLHFAGATPGCAGSPTSPLISGKVPVTVAGGDGSFAAASGTGTLTINRYLHVQTGCCGDSEGEVAFSLDAPNASFDVTPPVLSGAHSKTVRIPMAAKRAHVRYSVTAQDAVDGSVSAVCKPRSGSWFRPGRTKVTCSATDESGNTATAQFTITVKHRG